MWGHWRLREVGVGVGVGVNMMGDACVPSVRFLYSLLGACLVS